MDFSKNCRPPDGFSRIGGTAAASVVNKSPLAKHIWSGQDRAVAAQMQLPVLPLKNPTGLVRWKGGLGDGVVCNTDGRDLAITTSLFLPSFHTSQLIGIDFFHIHIHINWLVAFFLSGLNHKGESFLYSFWRFSLFPRLTYMTCHYARSLAWTRWRDSILNFFQLQQCVFDERQQLSHDRVKHLKEKMAISWDTPPPSKSGKWRFLGICQNPHDDC